MQCEGIYANLSHTKNIFNTMLVPSMTLAEIRKEIDKDFPIVYRKMGYVAEELKKKLSKEAKRDGVEVYYDYKSKYKNNWLLRMEGNKKKISYEATLIYHTGKNLVAISVTCESKMIYYTRHFFDRYNERLGLGLSTFNDILRRYLSTVPLFRFTEIEEIEPGVWTMFCIIPGGAILGTFYRNLALMKANTFVTTDMLHEDQHDRRMYLRDLYKEYDLPSEKFD